MQKVMCIFFTSLMVLFVQSLYAADITVTPTIRITTQSEKEASDKSHFKMDIEYPQFDGVLDPAAKKFNQVMNTMVNTEIANFKNQLTDNSSAAYHIPPEANNNELTIRFTPTVFTANKHIIVSIHTTKDYSYAGAAHGMNAIEVYNYDLTAGKEINLESLFKPNSDYLQKIANVCRQELPQKIKNDDKKWFNEGTAPTAKNYANWNLQSNGILFTFDNYQVAAYVYGQPQVLVPYSKLQALIPQSSLLSSCITDSCR